MSLVDEKTSLSVSPKPTSHPNKPTIPEIRPDEILDLFGCQFCYQTILAPVKQCENGHLICDGCHSNVLKCRTCQGTLRNIRNLAMEQVAEKMFSSKNTSEDGRICVLKLPTIAEIRMDSLVDLFECPVCYETVLPCIQQCENGHLICTSCHSKMSYCPICRDYLSSFRNLTMERVATKMMFPCKYRSEGCQTYLRSNEITEHQHLCNFRLYSCFFTYTSCSWHGPLDMVIEHLEHSHSDVRIVDGEHAEFLIPCYEWQNNCVRIQRCFGQHFVLVVEMEENGSGYQLCARVQLIGSRKQAEAFSCKLGLLGFLTGFMNCEVLLKVTSISEELVVSNKGALRVFFNDTTLQDSADCGVNMRVTVLKK